ncbi:MAG: TonB-dependent receptor [Ferruginibacter sp.]
MKKITTIYLFALLAASAAAQNTDTLHIVNLREVSVTGIKKNTQQQLVSFFKTNNAASLEDILSRLPEISLFRRGSYGMEPSIRYFNGGQINVQVDGMKIHGACTDKMDPVTIYIEPINLQSLQVQTAGNGFTNGSSIGGTVNMKMAEPDFTSAKKLTGAVSSGFQTAAKSLYESMRLNYAAGKWAFAASGTYRHNSSYRSGGGAVIPFSQYEKTNAFFSVKFQQNGHTYLKADLLADDGKNIGYSALPMDVGYAGARIASLSMHKERISKKLYKLQVKIYGNSIRHFMDDSKRPAIAMHMDMPGWSKTYGSFAEAEMKINHKQQLLLRADASSTFLKASMTMHQNGQPDMYMLTWPDNRRNQYGAAVTWRWLPDSTLQLQVNARADMNHSLLVSSEAKAQVSIFSNYFSQRNDLLKNIAAQLSRQYGTVKFTAGLSYSERMPTASELFGFYLFNASDGHDYIGNTALKTEKAVQADLAAVYTHRRSRVQLSGYVSKVQDFISAQVNPSFSVMTIGATAVKTYSNISYALVAGTEASAIFTPFKNTALVSVCRYTYAKERDGQPLPFVAPFKNITTLRYQHSVFSVQLEGETAAAQNRINKKSGEDATPAYMLLHARLGYKAIIFKKTAELQAGAENIFDRNYYEHLDWKNIPRPGRNIYLHVKFAF